MIVNILISSGILVALVLLQTNILHAIAIAGAVPDVALIVLISLSNRNGSMPGQTSGFVAGLVQDFVSLAPLGFNAFIRTLTGFLFGLTRGNIFVDPILVPMLMAFSGTLLKEILSGLLAAVFGIHSAVPALFSVRFLVELVYNSVLAPFVFGLMGLIRPLSIDYRSGNE